MKKITDILRSINRRLPKSKLLRVYLVSLILTLARIFEFRLPELLTLPALFVFIGLTLFYFVKFASRIFRRLLWRTRRKLIVSYIFMGLVPILLLLSLFLIGGWLFFGQTATELFRSTLDSYSLRTEMEAEKLLHLIEFTSPEVAKKKWLEELSDNDRLWLHHARAIYIEDGKTQLIMGDSPQALPGWLGSNDFSGLSVNQDTPFISAVHHDLEKKRAIQFLVPLTDDLMEEMKKKCGADLFYVGIRSGGKKNVEREDIHKIAKSSDSRAWSRWWDFPIAWFSLPDQYDWETGEKVIEHKEGDIKIGKQDRPTGLDGVETDADQTVLMGGFYIETSFIRIYNHLFVRQIGIQKVVFGLFAGLAGFFLLIELVSFISGFFIAKSITASVHNLFEGTEKVKSGDLGYKIKVSSKDQLGELAHSFNAMTESIQNLMVVRAEKERLAESLRIARQMQQNLLPREISTPAGMEVSTLNLAAQEVCGDYYDIIRNGEHQLAVIIADVSGKGPSAALYMAEVKGVILSITLRSFDPRPAMIEANAVLAPTLDSRNFITMSFALIDEKTKTMKLCRAGHNPLVHYSAAENRADLLQPGGIGLGLGRDGTFDRALEEMNRPLNVGDILVFYTDGLTEAMNPNREFFGEQRLMTLVVQNSMKSTEEIKELILNDLQGFMYRNVPQDDVTLVLVKILPETATQAAYL